MENRFSPYQGTKPFLFISYARGDMDAMLEVIAQLRQKNYRIWYDEGIPVGTDWPIYISGRVNAATAVLFFLSGKSMVSPNCHSEIVSASQSGKRIICIALDSSAQLIQNAIRRDGQFTENEIKEIKAQTAPYAAQRKSRGRLPECTQWLAPLAEAQFISGDESGAASQILAQGVLDSRFVGPYRDRTTQIIHWKRPLAAIAACFALLAAIGFQIYRWQNTTVETAVMEALEPENTTKPTIDPESVPYGLRKVISFPDTQQERAVRKTTGIETGDLQEQDLQSITELYFCGKTVLQMEQPMRYSDGSWYVNGAPVLRGAIQDLSIMEKMYYLESLTMVGQNITSINALSRLEILQHLNISGNPITSLSLKDGFRNLVTLNISHTGIRSLVGIAPPDTLKIIYVSADMLPLELDQDASYQVLLVR